MVTFVDCQFSSTPIFPAIWYEDFKIIVLPPIFYLWKVKGVSLAEAIIANRIPWLTGEMILKELMVKYSEITILFCMK